MSPPQQTTEQKEPRSAAQPKPVESGTVELQKIRRELLTLATRVEKLAKGQEQA